MNVREMMRKDVLTVRPTDHVADVAGELCDVHVGCAVVVEENRPVGVVTDRDISVRLDANWADTREATVADVMTADPVTVPADATVFEVSRTMADNGVRRVPVVDGDELVGIVTQDDVILLLSAELHNLARTIETESPPEEWGRTY